MIVSRYERYPFQFSQSESQQFSKPWHYLWGSENPGLTRPSEPLPCSRAKWPGKLRGRLLELFRETLEWHQRLWHAHSATVILVIWPRWFQEVTDRCVVGENQVFPVRPVWKSRVSCWTSLKIGRFLFELFENQDFHIWSVSEVMMSCWLLPIIVCCEPRVVDSSSFMARRSRSEYSHACFASSQEYLLF